MGSGNRSYGGDKKRRRRKTVERRDGTNCHYCGVETILDCNENDPRKRTLDHVICHSQGGSMNSANLVIACKSCNNLRGDLTYFEFIARFFDVPKFTRITPEMFRPNDPLDEAMMALVV